MSENDYKPNTGQDAGLDAEPANDAETADAPADKEAASADAQQEIAALNERVLRIAAELENTRRRAEREKADAGRYAIANFARDLLDVADNFDRALRAADGVKAEETSAGDAIAGLLDGVRMTEKELLQVLERHGVRRVMPEGLKFDPNLHQAVAHVPHAEIPSGHVVDVAQPGFTIGERVLRAAMVTVSAGSANAGPSLDKSAGAGLDDTDPSGGNLDTEV